MWVLVIVDEYSLAVVVWLSAVKALADAAASEASLAFSACWAAGTGVAANWLENVVKMVAAVASCCVTQVRFPLQFVVAFSQVLKRVDSVE